MSFQASDLLPNLDRIVTSLQSRRSQPVMAGIDKAKIREKIAARSFEHPSSLSDVANFMLEMLQDHAVRSDHPRYLGLFNPPSLEAAIVGDLIAAVVNPQLAVWSHAPAACEMERAVLDLFGQSIWANDEIAGFFTSGGSEANAAALSSALAARYEHWERDGLNAVQPRKPMIFVSSEAHLAWIKIARLAGLGATAVKLVVPEDGLSLGGTELKEAILREGGDPVLIVSTAGATAHGAVDRTAELAQVAAETGTWLHVDAAWAGSLLIDKDYRSYLPGVQLADSITIDPHKWLAVPMGAGMFLSRNWAVLEAAYSVSTSYMPSASTVDRDMYIHSPQWSRRFIGAKVYAALQVHGLSGYHAMFERQFELADHMRLRLLNEGWSITNDTPLPLVCFTRDGFEAIDVEDLVARVQQCGSFWISTVRCKGRTVARACITSPETTQADVDSMIDYINEAVRRPASRRQPL